MTGIGVMTAPRSLEELILGIVLGGVLLIVMGYVYKKKKNK